MKIQSSRRVLHAALREAEARGSSGEAGAEPPVGFVALAGTPPGRSGGALRGGVLVPPQAAGQTFDAFMKSAETRVARSLWSLVRPGVPPHLRNAVGAAWIVLDATALFARWQRMPPLAGPPDLAELAFDTTVTALDALSLVNSAAGRPSADIGSVALALRHGKAAIDGKDPTWLTLNVRLTRESPLYDTGDRVLKLVEAGLSTDPDLAGITLNPVRAAADPRARWPFRLSPLPAVPEARAK